MHECGDCNGLRTCNYSSISVQFLPALISYPAWHRNSPQREELAGETSSRRNSCLTNTESDAYLIDRGKKRVKIGDERVLVEKANVRDDRTGITRPGPVGIIFGGEDAKERETIAYQRQSLENSAWRKIELALYTDCARV